MSYKVEIVYDPKKKKLRAKSDDGIHGEAWCWFPNSLRTKEGLIYEVPDIEWHEDRHFYKVWKENPFTLIYDPDDPNLTPTEIKPVFDNSKSGTGKSAKSSSKSVPAQKATGRDREVGEENDVIATLDMFESLTEERYSGFVDYSDMPYIQPAEEYEEGPALHESLINNVDDSMSMLWG